MAAPSDAWPPTPAQCSRGLSIRLVRNQFGGWRTALPPHLAASLMSSPLVDCALRLRLTAAPHQALAARYSSRPASCRGLPDCPVPSPSGVRNTSAMRPAAPYRPATSPPSDFVPERRFRHTALPDYRKPAACGQKKNRVDPVPAAERCPPSRD